MAEDESKLNFLNNPNTIKPVGEKGEKVVALSCETYKPCMYDALSQVISLFE